MLVIARESNRILGAAVLVIATAAWIATAVKAGGAELRRAILPLPGIAAEHDAANAGRAAIQLAQRDTSADAAVSRPATEVRVKDLIGTSVRNQENQTVGPIEEVLAAPDGKIKSVVVAVGPYVGLEGHKVKLDWSELRIYTDGERFDVAINLSRENIKGLPPYK